METLINTFQKKTKKENTDLSSLHFHSGYELIFVINGEVTIEIDAVPHKAKSPAIILLNPFEQHRIIKESDEYERIILVLNSDILEQNISPRLIAMLKCRPQNFSHIIKPSENDFINICSILDNTSHELNCNGIFSAQYIQNCIYNMLILIYRTKKTSPELSMPMMKIQTFIDMNYSNIDSIQDIADKFCLSASHLSRTFKTYSGYSPVEYLLNIRLYRAQQLLIYSDLNINEISAEIGFKDSNNFIRQFSKRFKVSPLKFRKENRV